MNTFRFNTIYIIESLKDDEIKTGYNLYGQLKPLEDKYNDLKVVFAEVHSKTGWNTQMADILNKCKAEGVYPILHLEIHGWEEGIEFANGDELGIDDINDQFRAINLASQCNLFITLGICKGLYVLFGAQISKTMPYCGAVGSFDDLINVDIQMRYADFYETFFRTFNIYEAYKSLMTAETGFEPKYRYIPIDEIFFKCYQDYLDKGCTAAAVKERAIDSMGLYKHPLVNRREKRKFQRDFVKLEQKTRVTEYHKAAKSFFALDAFPDNEERFGIPKNFKELKEKYKTLII